MEAWGINLNWKKDVPRCKSNPVRAVQHAFSKLTLIDVFQELPEGEIYWNLHRSPPRFQYFWRGKGDEGGRRWLPQWLVVAFPLTIAIASSFEGCLSVQIQSWAIGICISTVKFQKFTKRIVTYFWARPIKKPTLSQIHFI